VGDVGGIGLDLLDRVGAITRLLPLLPALVNGRCLVLLLTDGAAPGILFFLAGRLPDPRPEILAAGRHAASLNAIPRYARRAEVGNDRLNGDAERRQNLLGTRLEQGGLVPAAGDRAVMDASRHDRFHDFLD